MSASRRMEGDILIPTGDGLGFELNRKAMAKYPFASPPVRMFQYAVYDIRPPDEKSYFNLGEGS